MAGSWVEVNDASPTRSGADQSRASGSFNYTGPSQVFGQVDTSAFWRRDAGGFQLASGDALGVPVWAWVAGAAVLAWAFVRKAR